MSFTCIAPITAPVERNIEPVGPHFLAYARRKLNNRSFSEDERIEAEKHFKHAAEVVEESDDEEETEEMMTRDPKEWKGQDHYAVLGLSKYRYKASLDQIRRAHRKKVLKHHPDKKAAMSGGANDDSFFKCIQKAFETLSDPVKRRHFDSVDEEADAEQPSRKEKGDFFANWAPFFEAESRFSNIQPVPQLGDLNSPKEEVDRFYDFWYRFDSWRSFEYLDKDVPDDSDNRDNKRFQEKKNKNERQKRKVEDTQRLRKAVDDALASDPRIKMFKQQEKEAKEKRKWDREAGSRAAAEEARKKKEEEERQKAEQEEREKQAQADNKKAKEDKKKAIKKEKKIIKGSLKDNNYFGPNGSEPSPIHVDQCLSDVDVLTDKFEGTEQADFAASLEKAKSSGPDSIKSVFEDRLKHLVSQGRVNASQLKFFKVE